MSVPFTEMERDDDEGIGYVSESHFLKSPSLVQQQEQAMMLLQLPSQRDKREGSISSNVSDMDVPIYSSENLTTRPIREKPSWVGKQEAKCRL